MIILRNSATSSARLCLSYSKIFSVILAASIALVVQACDAPERPEQASDTAETVTGELTVLIEDDFESGHGRQIVFIQDSQTGEKLRVHFPRGQAQKTYRCR